MNSTTIITIAIAVLAVLGLGVVLTATRRSDMSGVAKTIGAKVRIETTPASISASTADWAVAVEVDPQYFY
ncbi:MAG: hypothetical protein ACKOAQ_06220 [Acidimicrobiaceae bacterium]